MVSAQERLTRTFTRSSHTYTRTERTEISKTRGGETKREVRVEESTQVGGGGSPFRDVFGDFLGRESLSSFAGITARPEGENRNLNPFFEMWKLVCFGLNCLLNDMYFILRMCFLPRISGIYPVQKPWFYLNTSSVLLCFIQLRVALRQ